MDAAHATIAILVDGAPGTEPRQITVDALTASIDGEANGARAEVCNTSTLRHRRVDDYSGLLVAPGSPYDDPATVEEWIRAARERGIPLVGN